LSDDEDVTIPIHRPGLKEKLFFFISGIIVSVPLTLFVDSFSGYLCINLPLFYAQICSVAILTPFVEEFAKAYPLFYRHGETQRSIFILGFLVGLGFGVAEFLLYVLSFGAPVYLRFPAVLFHASSTSITAYGIATHRPIRFYLTAVLLHLANNFFAIFGQLWYLGGFIALVAAYFLSWYLYTKTSDKIVVT
jgi:RsiW-degrading membrane proteinase PrsW (M82 family)